MKKSSKPSIASLLRVYLVDVCSTVVSMDIWLVFIASSWIRYLHKVILRENPALYHRYYRLNVLKQSEILPSLEAFQTSPDRPVTQTTGFLAKLEHKQSTKQATKQALNREWEKESLISLPSYHSLCLLVRDELNQEHSVPEPFNTLFAFFGFGHFFTDIGRYHWLTIFKNYQIFLLTCCGVWTDTTVRAYNIVPVARKLTSTKVTSSMIVNDHERTNAKSNFLTGFDTHKEENSVPKKEKEANKDDNEDDIDEEVMIRLITVMVSSRVILLQFIPIISIFSIVAVTFASTPLIIRSPILQRYLPAFLIWDSRKVAWKKELEMFPTYRKAMEGFLQTQINPQQVSTTANDCITVEEYFLYHYSWRLHFHSWMIFLLHSRLFSFLNSLVLISLSFLFLFYSMKILWIIIVLLALLLPFLFSQVLWFILFIGKQLDLTDEDLVIFYHPNYQTLSEEFNIKQKQLRQQEEKTNDDKSYMYERAVVLSESYEDSDGLKHKEEVSFGPIEKMNNDDESTPIPIPTAASAPVTTPDLASIAMRSISPIESNNTKDVNEADTQEELDCEIGGDDLSTWKIEVDEDNQSEHSRNGSSELLDLIGDDLSFEMSALDDEEVFTHSEEPV